MKSEEFYAFFPRADVRHFKLDVNNNVLFDPKLKFNPNDILDDVGEPGFWQGEGPKYLGLSTNDLKLWKKDKLNFFRNYREKHYFNRLKIKNDSDVNFAILIKKIWEPIEFSVNDNEIPPKINLKLQEINFWNFRIYVNLNDYFVLNDTNPYNQKISEIKWDDDKNEYTLLLKVMYVLSYLGGMSIQNLRSENNLAKSLSYFYFYYHLKKFYNYRSLAGYDYSALEKEELFKSLYHWSTHHVYYHPHMKMGDSEFKKNKHDVIANVHKDGKWIKWMVREEKRDITNDYLKLINTLGEGLTKIGQLLFQESCQAYVYAILGAQAKTHWKIIGDGANSYQTQKIFKTLINEIVAQNNISNLIKSMRLAIKATKVRLNFCISPGLELLPSEMIYIKDSPGYNNILLVSTKNQKFGVNSGVNLALNSNVKLPSNTDKIPANKKIAKIKQNSSNYKTNTSTIEIIGASLLLAIAGRLIWVAI